MAQKVKPGSPYPLGANWDGRGTNFALFSANATKVELCFFDSKGKREVERIALPEYTDEVWHGYFEDIQPGQLYGYRVHGPHEPHYGHRFNPYKLLIDPYARMLAGDLKWHDALFGYRLGHPREDLIMDRRDSAPHMPKCRVVEPVFMSEYDKHPGHDWENTIIYEAHVKGLTWQREDVPIQMRGTFAGLGQPQIVEHLAKLGVTAIELLPIHAFVNDRFLVDKGLRNYWGYNTIAFFAIHQDYLANPVLREMRACVHNLHQAGIEVILDVVYNHTAEGNQLGPCLSFKGIDNASYYTLAKDRRYYYDTTGCGNNLNISHPRVLQMVMDSLRYWVTQMDVDGFRFDLATTLARDPDDFGHYSGFLRTIRQDPVLSKVKLIAEPWDVGHGGYRVGDFPAGWSEWNGRYRDTLREYWKGTEGVLPELASRLAGSSDIYDHAGRRPHASINFITAHDGFTLMDLVSYNHPHNEANKEKSGHADNKSWNCGAEGPTDRKDVNELRLKQIRNFLASLLFSQGVPMLLGGDEMGRMQHGNNNAYCQDNEISWFDWNLSAMQKEILKFTKHAIKLRKAHPSLRRAHFFTGQPAKEGGRPDILWFSPDGTLMEEEDWMVGHAKALGVQIADERGDDPLLLLFNAHHEDVPFKLPEDGESAWQRLVDTAIPMAQYKHDFRAHEIYPLQSRSLVLFRGVG